MVSSWMPRCFVNAPHSGLIDKRPFYSRYFDLSVNAGKKSLYANTDNGSVLFKCPNKPWQWDNMSRNMIQKLKQPDDIQPLLIYTWD